MAARLMNGLLILTAHFGSLAFVCFPPDHRFVHIFRQRLEKNCVHQHNL